MSFSLYQVTQRAAGGEIARTRKIDAVAPVIGRGADCDIHLPDLAVDLRHARMSEGADGRVLVEALGLLGFVVGGRFTRRAELDPARGAEVVIGRNRLILSRADDGGVKVSISAVSSAADAGASDEKAIFDPPAPVFGRRPLAWTLGLAILLLCLAAPATLFFLHGQRTLHADQQWTSGPLSRSHAFLRTDCQACHAKAFVAVRDEACLSCHRAGGVEPGAAATPRLVKDPGGPPPILIRVHAPAHRLLAGAPYPADLPGRLTEWLDKAVDHPNDRCASCHVEHVSVRDTAFAGGERPRDTPLLKTVNDCVDCHASLKSRLPTTALRDTADWRRHPDFRPFVAVGFSSGEVMIRREALADAAPTATGLIFSHRLHLAPGGGVARMALELGAARGYGGPLDCGACHHPSADGRGFHPVEMERDCRGCHTMAFARNAAGVRVLPHGPVRKLVAFLRSFYGERRADFSAGSAVDAGRRRPGESLLGPFAAAAPARAPSDQATGLARASGARGGACVFCHKVSATAGALPFAVEPTPQLMRHMPAGGFDHGVRAHHQDAAGGPNCGACHAARISDSAAAVLLPAVARCQSCHGARGSDAPAVIPAASGCAECHDYHAPGQPKLSPRERHQITAWRPRLSNGS